MLVRSRLPAGEVGVVRQVVDQLADHETVVELGRHGDVTSAALLILAGEQDAERRPGNIVTEHADERFDLKKPLSE
ncbi:MAG: hypothetical protein ACRDS0_19100 [Pseudonocardiaceae bacterium]